MQIALVCIVIFKWCYQTPPYPKLTFNMLRATQGIGGTLCSNHFFIVNFNLFNKQLFSPQAVHFYFV